MNRKLAKKAAEKKRTEPRRKLLIRQAQTDWRSRDERDLEVEVKP